MAEGLIAKRDFGDFQNKSKWINEYIVDYCKEKLELDSVPISNRSHKGEIGSHLYYGP